MKKKNLLILALGLLWATQGFAQVTTLSDGASWYLAVYTDNTYQVVSASTAQSLMADGVKGKTAYQIVALASISKSTNMDVQKMPAIEGLQIQARAGGGSGGTVKYCACRDEDPNEICEVRYVRCDSGDCRVCCGYALESVRGGLGKFYTDLASQGVMVKRRRK